MNKATRVLPFIFLMVLAANCINVNQEYVNMARNFIPGGADATPYVNGCQNFHNFWSYDFPVDQRDHHANLDFGFTFLRTNHARKVFSDVSKMQFTKRSSVASFENYVQANSVSGVLAKVMVAIKINGIIHARGGLGGSTCAMTQLYETITEKPKRRLLCDNGPPASVTKTVPRGFNPHELETVQNFMQQQAAQEVYNLASHHLQLRAAEPEALTTLHAEEARKLRRWYREMTYNYADMEDIHHTALGAAFHHGCFKAVHDPWVQNRLMEVASWAPKTSVFYAPDGNALCVAAINKVGDNYSMHVSSFIVMNRMPAGAFGWSTGNWHLERAGHASSPNAYELIAVFPPIK